MKEKKKVCDLTCGGIEIAVANYFNPRIHLIVPNISHGMHLHECDLLVMNGKNYGVEVEIKISKADIKKDLQKGHGHNSNRIRRLFFAIPEFLYTDEVIALIPERAGIFVIKPGYWVKSGYGNSHYISPKCIVKRNAKINKAARAFTDRERLEMGRLGMLRYWNIRNQIGIAKQCDTVERSVANEEDSSTKAACNIKTENTRVIEYLKGKLEEADVEPQNALDKYLIANLKSWIKELEGKSKLQQ